MRTIFILALLFSSPLYAGLDELIPSTARVETVHETIGTAFTFHEDSKFYWLLTAGHVVYFNGKADEHTLVRFYGDLEPSDLISVDVVNSVHNDVEDKNIDDLAVLRLDKKNWPHNYVAPNIISLSTINSKKIPIFSFGAANGGLLTGIKGNIIDDLGYGGISFLPVPAHGRSGSGIFQNIDGRTKCIGVIIYTTNRGGVAISADKIKDKLKEWKIKY